MSTPYERYVYGDDHAPRGRTSEGPGRGPSDSELNGQRLQQAWAEGWRIRLSDGSWYRLPQNDEEQT